MGSGVGKVEYESCFDCVDNMLSVNNKIKDEISDIKSLISTLTGSLHWEGAVSDYCETEYFKTLKDCEDLIDTVEDYIYYMKYKIEKYKEFESKIIEGLDVG